MAGVELLADPGTGLCGPATYNRIVSRLREASRAAEIHMFVWRRDETGQRIGREVLAAADRGVRVRILKDLGALMYERIEMNGKSFFRRAVPAWKRLSWWVSSFGFPSSRVADSFDSQLGDGLQRHENVTIDWVNHTHTKYYLLDEATFLTGSVHVEDRHLGYWDYMVEIRGAESIGRLRARQQGAAPMDLSRSIEFVLNRGDRFEIKPVLRRLLAEACDSVYVEMAYLGDPEISRSLVHAARRGVDVASYHRFLSSMQQLHQFLT